MKNPDTTYLVVGKIGAAYGVRGWLKIQSYTELGISILDYQPWFMRRTENAPWQPVEIEDGRVHGNGLVIKFVGVESPEAARLLTGNLIAVPRSTLPTLNANEYYWTDLEGLTVFNQHGEKLGKIIYLLETGSNDVIVVKGEKEHAIPYSLGDVITQIDLEKKEMHVHWEPL